MAVWIRGVRGASGRRVIGRFLSDKGRVLMCGTCMDARGLGEKDAVEGATRSGMDEVAQAMIAADKVVKF
jgi:uncharacterized protein involved in oxidation of intracellular sulfur